MTYAYLQYCTNVSVTTGDVLDLRGIAHVFFVKLSMITSMCSCPVLEFRKGLG